MILGVLVFFAIGIIGVTSCGDDVKDALGCVELASEYSTASYDYTANPTTTTCNDYKEAIQAYIDDCDQLTATEIATYQATLDELDCDNL